MHITLADGVRVPASDTIVRENTNIVSHPNQERIRFEPFLDVCNRLARTLYIGPFRNALNVGTNEDYFDIQVGQSFVQRWRTYKTGPVKAENQAAYRISQELARIFGFEDIEINATDDGQTLQIFLNGLPYRLNEVGSGLTQFILVLSNAAIRRPSLILIDEPELNLHPSLQLDFLTTLGSYAEEGVLFSTHSHGLARASADRVYAVERIGQGESDVRPLESVNRLSEFLGELSYAGYSELGFQKVLLVEGPTEVRAIQQFLRALKKDHEIVLLPLGGGTMINERREVELQEIKRISNHVFALIDSEKREENAQLAPARAGFVRICDAAGISVHVLERRATENYLSDRAVKAVKGDKYRALAPFENLRDVNAAWAKEENWRIAREMTVGELTGTDLHTFLEAL